MNDKITKKPIKYHNVEHEFNFFYFSYISVSNDHQKKLLCSTKLKYVIQNKRHFYFVYASSMIVPSLCHLYPILHTLYRIPYVVYPISYIQKNSKLKKNSGLFKNIKNLKIFQNFIKFKKNS